MLFLKKYLESKVSLSNVNVKTETSSLQTPQVPVYSQPGIKLKKAHTKIIQPPKEEKISSQTNLSQSVPPADPFSDQANIDNKQLAKLPKTKVITRKIKESLFKAAHVFNPEAIPSELIAPIIGDKPITRSNATKLI
jgi:hypothetical protein